MKKETVKKASSCDSRFDKLDGAMKQTLDRYFSTLRGHQTSGLHQLVGGRIEKLLLEYVLKKTDYHQRQTAKMLGISRTTLRNKIARYKINNKKTEKAGRKNKAKKKK